MKVSYHPITYDHVLHMSVHAFFWDKSQMTLTIPRKDLGSPNGSLYNWLVVEGERENVMFSLDPIIHSSKKVYRRTYSSQNASHLDILVVVTF